MITAYNPQVNALSQAVRSEIKSEVEKGFADADAKMCDAILKYRDPVGTEYRTTVSLLEKPASEGTGSYPK